MSENFKSIIKKVKTFVFDIDGPARIDNFCAKLAENDYGRDMYLAILSDVVADPLGEIWITPKSYKEARGVGDDPTIPLFEGLSTEEALAAHSVNAESVVD